MQSERIAKDEQIRGARNRPQQGGRCRRDRGARGGRSCAYRTGKGGCLRTHPRRAGDAQSRNRAHRSAGGSRDRPARQGRARAHHDRACAGEGAYRVCQVARGAQHRPEEGGGDRRRRPHHHGLREACRARGCGSRAAASRDSWRGRRSTRPTSSGSGHSRRCGIERRRALRTARSVAQPVPAGGRDRCPRGGRARAHRLRSGPRRGAHRARARTAQARSRARAGCRSCA